MRTDLGRIDEPAICKQKIVKKLKKGVDFRLQGVVL